VAVLIPLLFMGDVVGRLFREFAVSLAVTIVMSAVVALTLVPMLAARWLRPEHEERRFALVDKAMHQFRPAGPCLCPRARLGDARAALTLLVFAGAALTALLFWSSPRTCSRRRTPGRSAPRSSPRPMSLCPHGALQQQVAAALLEDPAVASLRSAWMASTPRSTRAHAHQPEAHRQRDSQATVLAHLQERAAGAGRALFFQPVQDLTIDTETGLTPYRFAPRRRSDAVNEWGAKLAAALHESTLRNVNAQLAAGRAVVVDINRDAAARLGYGADHRQCALRCLWPAHHLDHLHPVQPEPRDPSATPQMLSDPAALAQLYIPLLGHAGAAGHRRHDPQGEAPLVLAREASSPATIGFDLAPGVSLGHAVSRSSSRAEIGLPAVGHHRFLGRGRAFQSALANELVLVLAAIVVVYIVLGVLYESFIHPSRSSPPCPRRASAR
jgi:multidrug efflux pump